MCVVANAYLVHHDPEIYPDPYAFRPERFLEEQPGTYTWIPFGGGRRRCLGASFALVEMKIVLQAVLSRCEVRPGIDGAEVSRRRAITVSPNRRATTVLHDRPAVRGNGRATEGVAEPAATTLSRRSAAQNCIDFTWRYSSRACLPSSRPWPDCL